MPGTATPVHHSNECNIPFKEAADELKVLTRCLPSQYFNSSSLKSNRGTCKKHFARKNRKPKGEGSQLQSQRNLMQPPHKRIMAECLSCVINEAVYGQRLVQTTCGVLTACWDRAGGLHPEHCPASPLGWVAHREQRLLLLRYTVSKQYCKASPD